MKIAGLVVKKTDKSWEVRFWGPLPPEDPETSEEPGRGKVKVALLKVALLVSAVLAVAVLGLVILMVVKNAPEWGELLRKLVALMLLTFG